MPVYNFYTGALAETVSNPSILTYSFLKHWFSGKHSLGRGMQLLSLPYSPLDLPDVILVDGTLLVDLSNEEKIFFSKTIFIYQKRTDWYAVPKISVNVLKLFNPFCLFTTIGVMMAQSQWAAKPQETLKKAQEFIEKIPKEVTTSDLQELDSILTNQIWPYVIAVGAYAEFFSQYVDSQASKMGKTDEISSYMTAKAATDDWFFHSLSDQQKVKEKKLSFEDYIKEYGMRSDKDYDLACPRWHEIPQVLKKRVTQNTSKLPSHTEKGLSVDKKLQILIDANVSFEILRSQARRKSLPFINALRQAIIKKAKKAVTIELLTRDELLYGKVVAPQDLMMHVPASKQVSQTNTTLLSASSGAGMRVSPGIATGITKVIKDANEDIPAKTIGIFSNASPEFAAQYPKCAGMIFLQGGQTSHGAIVAREFGIPALIDNKASAIKNNVEITIDGTKGAWAISSI